MIQHGCPPSLAFGDRGRCTPGWPSRSTPVPCSLFPVPCLFLHTLHSPNRSLHHSCSLPLPHFRHTLATLENARNSLHRRFCPDSGAIRVPKPAPDTAIHAFHSPKSAVLRLRAHDCTLNTRYCGLVLTCTIDSAIFSSAAHEWIVNRPDANLAQSAAENKQPLDPSSNLIQSVVQSSFHSTVLARQARMVRLSTNCA